MASPRCHREVATIRLILVLGADNPLVNPRCDPALGCILTPPHRLKNPLHGFDLTIGQGHPCSMPPRRRRCSPSALLWLMTSLTRQPV